MKNSLFTLLLFVVVVLQSCQKDFGDYPTYQTGVFNYKMGSGRVMSEPITFWKEVKFNYAGYIDCGIKFGECRCCPEVLRAIQNSNKTLIGVTPSQSFWVTNVQNKTCK